MRLLRTPENGHFHYPCNTLLEFAEDNIAERTGHALARERSSEVHRQWEMLTGHITRLEADLSQTLNVDKWPRIDQLCRKAARIMYNIRTSRFSMFLSLT